jgi:hypothetical protein
MSGVSIQKGVNLIGQLLFKIETIYMYDIEPMKTNIKRPMVNELPQLPQLPQILKN